MANASEVERALHTAFGPHRINPRREFFQIDPEQAIAILKLLHVQDATREVADQQSAVDEQELAAAERFQQRRPRLNFDEMGIPLGSELQSTDDGVSDFVVGPTKVRLGDEELSLSAATQRVLKVDYAVRPGSHWTYNGKSLHDIYEETYAEL